MARFRVPHTLVLLFGMVVLALLMTYLLPQGSFERATNEQGREQVVPGSYSRAESQEWLSPAAAFTAIPKGFEAAGEIIFFVFIAGGLFGVLRATGAVDALIGLVLRSFGHRPLLLIASTILVFAIGSTTIGMAEEYIPFVPILLALALALGFDSMTAIGMLCIGYGIGYGAAAFNPFTVLVAQGVAGLQPTSGWVFRMVLLAAFAVVGIHHVWSYARKVRDDPGASLVADIEPPKGLDAHEQGAPTTTHWLVLTALAAAIILSVYGLSPASGWHWYIVEMGAVFVAVSILMGILARLSPDRVASEFCAGAAELTTTALLIGFARSILVVLENGQVIDTLVHAISLPLQSAGTWVAAIGMLVFQSLCNLFIPSGSGQAYVTMPLMAPIADLVGIERQVAVLAYQFGDGFTNILVPTNAVLIGILTMARIPYDRWVRFILPFMVKIWAVSGAALLIAIGIGYS